MGKIKYSCLDEWESGLQSLTRSQSCNFGFCFGARDRGVGRCTHTHTHTHTVEERGERSGGLDMDMDMDMDMQNISAKDVARLAEEGGGWGGESWGCEAGEGGGREELEAHKIEKCLLVRRCRSC